MEKNKFQIQESNSQEESIARSRIYCQKVHFDDVFESSQETNDQNVVPQNDNTLKTITNNSQSQSRKTNNNGSQKSPGAPKKKSNNNTRKTSTPKKKNTPRNPLSTCKPVVPSHLKTYLASEDEHVQAGPYQQFKINTPKELPQTAEVINISSSTSPDVSDHQDGHLNSKRIKTSKKNDSYSIPRDPPPIINISSTTSSSSPSPSPPPPCTQRRKLQSHHVSAKSKSKLFGFDNNSDSDAGNNNTLNKPTNTVNPEPRQPLVVPSIQHDVNYSQNYHETKNTLEEADSESEKLKLFQESQSQNYGRILTLSASFSQNCSIPDSRSNAPPILTLDDDPQIIKISNINEPFSPSVYLPSPPMFFSMPAKLTNNLDDSDSENMGSDETQYPDVVVPETLNDNVSTSDNNNIEVMEYDEDGEKTSPDIASGCQGTTISVIGPQDKSTKQPVMTDYFQIQRKLKKRSRKVKKLKKEVKKLKQELVSQDRAIAYSKMLKIPLVKKLMKGFDHEEHLRNQEQKRAERRSITAVICQKGECRCFCPPNWIGCECLCFCS